MPPATPRLSQANHDWSVFEPMKTEFGALFEKKLAQLHSHCLDWQSRLEDYGGEPSSRDWTQFRPLRLEREEDYSDWLAHLIEFSKTGYFSSKIFKLSGFAQSDYVSPRKCIREDPTGGYRADIVITWRDNSGTHVEVKIGDPNLFKTFDTAKKMRAKHQKCQNWSDFILLMRWQMPDWLYMGKGSDSPIRALTWEDIDLALRRSLLHSKESISWKAWAYAFIGAIEQKLLLFPRIANNEPNSKRLPVLESMINILGEGLRNE